MFANSAVINGQDGPYVKTVRCREGPGRRRANMKKLFSKIENTSKEPNSYIGKVFVVGRHTVTVEEVLAEGTYYSYSSYETISINTYIHISI